MEKPGYKTTEFWLSLIAVLLGAIMSSGALAGGGLAAQIIGGALALLGALGYTTNRTSHKNKQVMKEVAKALGPANDNTADPTKESEAA